MAIAVCGRPQIRPLDSGLEDENGSRGSALASAVDKRDASDYPRLSKLEMIFNFIETRKRRAPISHQKTQTRRQALYKRRTAPERSSGWEKRASNPTSPLERTAPERSSGWAAQTRHQALRLTIFLLLQRRSSNGRHLLSASSASVSGIELPSILNCDSANLRSASVAFVFDERTWIADEDRSRRRSHSLTHPAAKAGRFLARRDRVTELSGKEDFSVACFALCA